MAQETTFQKPVEDFRSRWERERREAFEYRKDALKNLLAQQDNIATVEAEYDGCGDSGQFNSMVFLDQGSKPLPRPTEELVEAVEEFICSLLTHEHAGWEINEGSYGTVKIDAKTLTGTLEHRDRIEEYHETEF